MLRTCIVCGDGIDGPVPVRLCSDRCVREAERELPLLVGRAHQLEQLDEWLTNASPWQVVLHPSQRRQAQQAQVEQAEVLRRIEQLERALADDAAARTRATRPDRLAPRGTEATPRTDDLTVLHDLTQLTPVRPRLRTGR